MADVLTAAAGFATALALVNAASALAGSRWRFFWYRKADSA